MAAARSPWVTCHFVAGDRSTRKKPKTNNLQRGLEKLRRETPMLTPTIPMRCIRTIPNPSGYPPKTQQLRLPKCGAVTGGQQAVEFAGSGVHRTSADDVTEELPPPRPPLRLLLLHGAAAIFEIVRHFAVIEWLGWLQRHIGDVGNNRRHLGEKGKKRSTISFRRVCSQLCRRRLRFSHIV